MTRPPPRTPPHRGEGIGRRFAPISKVSQTIGAQYPPPCGEGRPRQRTGWGSGNADRQRRGRPTISIESGTGARESSRNAAFASIVRVTWRSRLPTHALTRCAALALAILALSGCGRRGNLESAPGAAPPATPGQSTVAPGLDGSKAQKPVGISAPNEPFFLDPLL